MQRREVLAGGALAAIWLTACPAWSLMPARALSFHNLHTGEHLTTTYWRDGTYMNGALEQIDWVLRDFRTDTSHAMDPQLLDTLSYLSHRLGTDGRFEVISGYRSPASNALLAAESHGVAHNSFHMKGKAIDIRVPGVALAHLRDAARSLNAGGVGFYPDSDFVHIDTGPLRHW